MFVTLIINSNQKGRVWKRKDLFCLMVSKFSAHVWLQCFGPETEQNIMEMGAYWQRPLISYLIMVRKERKRETRLGPRCALQSNTLSGPLPPTKHHFAQFLDFLIKYRLQILNPWSHWLGQNFHRWFQRIVQPFLPSKHLSIE